MCQTPIQSISTSLRSSLPLYYHPEPHLMPELTTQSAAVTTPHPKAAAAALDVLNSGGNAIDAAVAAMLVATVLLPDQVAIGGYGGAITIYQASTNKIFSIDFDARAPKD